MSAWETLTAGSTLPSGTAWEHLQAQGGGDSVIIIGDGMDLEVDIQDMTVELSGVEMEIEVVEDAYDIEIDLTGMEVPV